MGQVMRVTGGSKSGKSQHVETLAAMPGLRVTYVATAAVCDAEMAARVRPHRASRPAAWVTPEQPLDLRAGLGHLNRDSDVMLVACPTLCTVKRLLALDNSEPAPWWHAVAVLEPNFLEELDEVMAAAREAPWHVVSVPSEVGCGNVPSTPLGHAFRHLPGALGRRVAAQAGAVCLAVAGLGSDLKDLAVRPAAWATAMAVGGNHPK